jgi:hypothetical protein
VSDTSFPDPSSTVCITSFSPSQLVQLFHCTPSPSVTFEGNLVAILSEPPSLAHGDRQMVAILAAVLEDGLLAVEAACAEALGQGVHSASVILNILARKKDPEPAVTTITPEALRLRHAPAADCARYDSLRKGTPWKEPIFSP